MRHFVFDDRIHRALDEVESWLGYEIKAIPMPDCHRRDAICGMGKSSETKEFELWYIEEEPQSQASYFHELAHVIQWIDGDPSVCTIHSTPLGLAPSEPVKKAWGLVQHIPVWRLVKEAGFDESETNNPCPEVLARLILRNELYACVPSEFITRFQAVELAFGLLCPAAPDRRSNLRGVAKRMIPEALELADEIVLSFEKQPQLSPQGSLTALVDLLHLLGVPTESLTVSFLSKTCPGFRSRILAVLNQTTSGY
ncbi:hypothetical protein LJC26_08000 [Desulfovibrio sp. OttesenSCG-928-O18]|nr:hypothetical protein [Desulfovibrio sp. OttesenSCG-928-O18]